MAIQTVSIGTHKNVDYDIGNPKVGRAVIFECQDCGLDVSEENILEHIKCNNEKSINQIDLAWASNQNTPIEKQCASCGTPFGNGDTAHILIADNQTRKTWPVIQSYCSDCEHIHMKATNRAYEDIGRFVWFNATVSTLNAEGECVISIDKDSGWFVPFQSIVPNE